MSRPYCILSTDVNVIFSLSIYIYTPRPQKHRLTFRLLSTELDVMSCPFKQ